MTAMRLVLACLFIAACSSHSTTLLVDAGTMTDGSAGGPACTGALYDPCTDSTQCMSGNCHLFNGAGLKVCTTACSASTPCANDVTGAPGFCNNMGICKPVKANSCTR